MAIVAIIRRPIAFVQISGREAMGHRRFDGMIYEKRLVPANALSHSDD